MILTTHLEFPRWAEVFGDPQLTGALLDRITHHCHTPALACCASVVECHGDIYRFKQSTKKRHGVT